MKRCPECRRDYSDDTLVFCLDDGAGLLDGPAKAEPPTSAGGFSSSDEPATAILSGLGVPPSGGSSSEPGAVVTGFRGDGGHAKPFINTADQTAILHTGAEAEPRESLGGPTEKQSIYANRAAKPLAALVVAVLLLVGGFFGYKYFAPAKQIESIAVMPFVNESGNADVEYLSDGMTETLISSLTQLPDLNVKARSTVFRYKGQETDVKTIGRELNVQAILNGRVAQRGDQLTLSLELVDVATENAIWSQRYSRKQADIVTLQSEIARDVSGKLKSKLSSADTASIEKIYTTNPEAYKLYLKGMFQYNRRTGDSLKQAAELFQQAIEKDPNYAQAYLGLAGTYWSFPSWSLAEPKDSYPKAKAAALRALELDDSLGEAHVVLGGYRKFEFDWVAAEKEFRRAIELDPKNIRAHDALSSLLVDLKRLDEGVAEARISVELDPLSKRLSLAGALIGARRYDEAISEMNAALRLDSNYAETHYMLALAYYGKGTYQEAIASYQKCLELDADDPVTTGMLAQSYAKAGNRKEALRILDKLKQEAAKRYIPGFAFAGIYSALGMKEEALKWLEKDVDDRSSYTSWYSVDPTLDDLRYEPRFKALLKRMNLPE